MILWDKEHPLSLPGGWRTPLTLGLWGLFSLLTWPWGGALTTAEAAKWALAESRVFEVQSLEQVVCNTKRSRERESERARETTQGG